MRLWPGPILWRTGREPAPRAGPCFPLVCVGVLVAGPCGPCSGFMARRSRLALAASCLPCGQGARLAGAPSPALHAGGRGHARAVPGQAGRSAGPAGAGGLYGIRRLGSCVFAPGGPAGGCLSGLGRTCHGQLAANGRACAGKGGAGPGSRGPPSAVMAGKPRHQRHGSPPHAQDPGRHAFRKSHGCLYRAVFLAAGGRAGGPLVLQGREHHGFHVGLHDGKMALARLGRGTGRRRAGLCACAAGCLERGAGSRSFFAAAEL